MSLYIAVGLSFCTRSVGAIGSVLFAVVLARAIGPAGLGQFTIFLSLLGVAAILAKGGQDMLLMRAIAVSDRKYSIPLLRFASRRILLPSLLIGVASALLLESQHLGDPFPGSAAASLALVPVLAVLALVAGYMKGLAQGWLAPLFEMGWISFVSVALLALAMLANAGTQLELTVVYCFTAALALVSILSLHIISRTSDRRHRWAKLPALEESWMRSGQSSFTLIALSGFFIQAGSFLMAAPFLAPSDIGLLRAGERLALLVSFSVLAVEPVISSYIVKYANQKDRASLHRVMGASLCFTGVSASLVCGALFLWPDEILSTMGDDFSAGVFYLKAMALAQLFWALAAPFFVFLNLTGGERISMWINLVILGLAAILFPLLCIFYGGIGFVVAYSGTLAVKSVIAVAFALRKARSDELL